MAIRAITGRLFYFIDDPYVVGDEKSYKYHENGALIIENGKITEVLEDASKLPKSIKEVDTYEHNNIIMPGFIDAHVHYAQLQMIGAHGNQLLEWLEKYTFISDQQFKDKEHGKIVANQFLKELIRGGVTTAVVFGTIHAESIDAFFEEAEKYNMLMIAGKELISRNAPDAVCTAPEQSYKESKDLIARWHNKGRLKYAVTPSFAIGCPDEELHLVSKLLQEHDDLYMQTHLSENIDEVETVLSLFPNRKNYTDVYDNHGLLREKAVFAHSIHLCESEFQRLHETGSAIAHCPTSNMFLGSGFFNMGIAKDEKRPVHVAMGSDVGAGTSLSALKTIGGAYKVSMVHKQSISAVKAFYLLTLGGAKALYLDNKIGTFKSGIDADIVVLNTNNTELMKFRQSYSKTIEEELFVLMTIGDDRNTEAVYVNGNKVYNGNTFKHN